MSISAQDLLRKIASDPHSSSESSQKSRAPKGGFKELLKVQRVDDRLKERNLFSLASEEEEEEDELKVCPLDPSMVKLPDPQCALGGYTPQLNIGGIESRSAPVTPLLSASAGLQEIFEKSASCMIVMCSNQETETTLFLDNPSSAFYGTRITIREFSTAPKAFNVEITSNPRAINAIDASKNDLLSAFKHSHFQFTIHRLDTHIQTSEDRPLFHRKESEDGQQQDPQERGDQ